MTNRQYTHSHWAAPLPSAELLAELAEAVRGPAPEGERWIGRTMAAWMSARLGQPTSVWLGWTYLVRLQGKRLRPRLRYAQAGAEEQETFKRTSGRSSGRLPPPSPTPRSRSGPSTNTGLG